MVLVGARNLKRGEATAKTITGYAHAVQLDVTDLASITAAAERIRREFLCLHLLINNAVISNTTWQPGVTMRECAKAVCAVAGSLDELRAVWQTNVFEVQAVFQAMLPLVCIAPDARIVNVSSGVGSLTAN